MTPPARTYWRSLEELAEMPEFAALVERELPRFRDVVNAFELSAPARKCIRPVRKPAERIRVHHGTDAGPRASERITPKTRSANRMTMTTQLGEGAASAGALLRRFEREHRPDRAGWSDASRRSIQRNFMTLEGSEANRYQPQM